MSRRSLVVAALVLVGCARSVTSMTADATAAGDADAAPEDAGLDATLSDAIDAGSLDAQRDGFDLACLGDGVTGDAWNPLYEPFPCGDASSSPLCDDPASCRRPQCETFCDNAGYGWDCRCVTCSSYVGYGPHAALHCIDPVECASCEVCCLSDNTSACVPAARCPIAQYDWTCSSDADCPPELPRCVEWEDNLIQICSRPCRGDGDCPPSRPRCAATYGTGIGACERIYTP